MIADGLEKRMPFRRVIKQVTIEKVMANRDVSGVKIELSGSLGGASHVTTRKNETRQNSAPNFPSRC